jgi:hypothetical protein
MFACSFEGGLLGLYTAAGFGGTWAIAAVAFKNGDGDGGNYSASTASDPGCVTPVLGTGNRYIHCNWHRTVASYAYWRIYRAGSVQTTGAINAAGFVELWRGTGTLIATSVAAVPDATGTWHGMTTELLAQDAGGIFTIWIDDVQYVTFAGDTQETALSDWDQVSFCASNTAYYDDIMVCTLAEEEAIVGVGNRIPQQICTPALVPAADVSVAMTPSAPGGNFAMIATIPAAVATWNAAIALLQEDVFSLTAPAYTIGTATAIGVWCYGGREGATTTVRTGITSGASTSYRPYYTMPAIPALGACCQIETLDPASGLPFTGADVTALKVRVQYN